MNIFRCCFQAVRRDEKDLGPSQGDRSIALSEGNVPDLAKRDLRSSGQQEETAVDTCARACVQGSLQSVQRLVHAIAGGCEEAWLSRIEFAVELVMEFFEAESASLYAVFDGGLAYANLSASGIGAEDFMRGVPYSVANDLTCSVALLLSTQLQNSAAVVRASVPSTSASVPTPGTCPGPSPLGPLNSLPPDWQRLHSAHRLRHFIAVPLCSGELVVGVLTLATRQGVVAPSYWQPDILGLVAASLSLLLQPRQLSIATSILTDVHLARNMDELVRVIRRGVHDLVVATTYLSPILRVALIRPDGSAAAVFEEQSQRRSSYSRLLLCSEPPMPPTGMPELLQPCTSRRSIDTSRLSTHQILMGQLTRDRMTIPNINVNCDPAPGPPGLQHALQPGSQSAYGGRPPSGPGVLSPGAPVGPGVVSPEGPGASLTQAASDSPLDQRSVSLALNERLAAAASMAGLGVGTFFSTNNGVNGNAGAGTKGGARGHGLSLGNTLLGEALQKDCGLWISDCTLYLQEARTVPRDIVVSRGSRAVHSIAVCSGRHNGTPLLGAYCVYGAVVPRQLLRAVTLELEQLLKLLSPSVFARLSSAALHDEWLYLHEELLNPTRVDHLRRMPRTSASMQPDGHNSVGIGAGGSPIRAPASPSGRLSTPRGVAIAAAIGGGPPGNATDPNVDVPPAAPPGQPANLYTPGPSIGGGQQPAGGGIAVGVSLTVGEGVSLPSGVLLSSARESFQTDAEVTAAPAAATTVAATGHASAAPTGGSSLEPPVAHGHGGGGRPGLLIALQALGVGIGAAAAMGGRPGSRGVMPSFSDALLNEQMRRGGSSSCMGDEPVARPELMHAAASGLEVGGAGGPAAAVPLGIHQLVARGGQQRPASLGSAVPSTTGATAFVTALLGSPRLGTGTTLRPAGGGIGGGAGGGGPASTGGMLRTVLAAPSFTVESVRCTLGNGLRRAPLVSGIHERLAAAQASRLVHGSAIEHQEELAAIDVLEKIGEGGYGEVYRGQYDGTEVAIKIVYEPNTATSAALPRITRTNAQVISTRHCGIGAEEDTGAATAARGLHDAFELTVSVSVCHPNIVQVLTFFTDVYVHVDRRTSSELMPSGPAAKSPARQMIPDMQPYGNLPAAPDLRGSARPRSSAAGNLGTSSRVTLLPYPHNNVTSCQLTTVDVTTSQFAEYTALQAAMASNGSAAQRAIAVSPPAMVICMEYCDAGSLADAIVRGSFRQPALGLYGSSQPNMKAIFATLLEVALALRHLHSLRLVHCDLKPSNVLLRSSHRDPRGFTAKLSDFGLVRLMEPCGEGGRLAIPKGVTHGTVTHMAPEVLESDDSVRHDASLDIYAFGIMMWQMVYGGRLYPGVNHSDIPTRVVREGMRPRFASNIPVEYRKLAESCWAANPAARPTAADIVQGLKELMGLGPRVNGQRRYSALAPPRKFLTMMPAVHHGGAAGTGCRESPGYQLRGGTAGTAAASEAGQGEPRQHFEGGEPVAGGLGGGADGGEGGGEAAGGISGTRSKSSGVRTRSMSYGSFPVHIL